MQPRGRDPVSTLLAARAADTPYSPDAPSADGSAVAGGLPRTTAEEIQRHLLREGQGIG